MLKEAFCKEYNLNELVIIVNDKIIRNKISLNKYISTDNMIVNRGGVELAKTLPSTQKFNHYLKGDTLFSNIRTYFRKIWLAEHEGGASPDVLIFRTKDQEILTSSYLYYILSNENFINHTVLTAKGVKMPRGDKTAIMQFKFLLPDITSQKIITNILISLDKKIEQNNKINQTLEQIAQTIFKSWFVDFEPTKAKIAALEAGGNDKDATLAAMTAISGKSVSELEKMRLQNPEEYNELHNTADLFPLTLEESELGLIPKKWEVASLKEVTLEIRRGISPKYMADGGVCVINQKCIRDHAINFSLARRNDADQNKVLGREIKIGDVLVNSTGVGTLGRLAPVRYVQEPTVFDTHITVVRPNTDKVTKSFIISLMIMKESYIEASGAGSTGQTELKRQVLEDILLCIPTAAILKKFENIAWPIHIKIGLLEQEIQALIKTRDFLLPKLLSGEINL